MSESQQSDFVSLLYDAEIESLTFLNSSNYPATPSGSQYIFDTIKPSVPLFIQPAVPLTIPSSLKRVGPDRRKAYVLYNKMTHSE